MLLRIVSVFSLAALATVSATAQNSDEKPPKEKKICRMQTDTGTILRKRICHSAAEWAHIEEAQSSNAKRMLDQRNLGPGQSR